MYVKCKKLLTPPTDFSLTSGKSHRALLFCSCQIEDNRNQTTRCSLKCWSNLILFFIPKHLLPSSTAISPRSSPLGTRRNGCIRRLLNCESCINRLLIAIPQIMNGVKCYSTCLSLNGSGEKNASS